MMKLTKSLCHNHGFTLIELIMTIVVVTIIAVPTAFLLSDHIENTFWINDNDFAINLARFDIEKIKITDYNNVISASFPNYLGYNYDIIRSVSVLDPLDILNTDTEELKQVNVSVRKSGSSEDLITLVTYLAKNVTNGQ